MAVRLALLGAVIFAAVGGIFGSRLRRSTDPSHICAGYSKSMSDMEDLRAENVSSILRGHSQRCEYSQIGSCEPGPISSQSYGVCSSKLDGTSELISQSVVQMNLVLSSWSLLSIQLVKLPARAPRQAYDKQQTPTMEIGAGRRARRLGHQSSFSLREHSHQAFAGGA